MNRSSQLTNLVLQVYNQVESALVGLELDRDSFLSSGLDHYTDLMENKGQEKVLRSLALLSATSASVDEERITSKTHEVLQKLVESGSIRAELLEECPNCEQQALRLYECLSCGFSFVQDFRCPFMVESNRRVCNRTKNPCEKIGLEYEECDILQRGMGGSR